MFPWRKKKLPPANQVISSEDVHSAWKRYVEKAQTADELVQVGLPPDIAESGQKIALHRFEDTYHEYNNQ